MTNAATIAKLNDTFRANPILGTTILTAGIRNNSSEDIARIMNKVRNFKDFDEITILMAKMISRHLTSKGRKSFGKLIIMTAILNFPHRMPQTQA